MNTPPPDSEPTKTLPPDRQLLATTLAQPPQVQPTPASLGRFGDYELEAELARGGMGVVYRARHVGLNRRVALKMILAGQYASPAAAQRFRIEAEAAAALDHPHIVPIYETGACDGKTYFTMKLVDGETLAARLRHLAIEQRRGDTLRGLVHVLLQVTQAVAFAHQRGVIHRDLKPANILLERSGNPYVVDFGLAKREAVDLGGATTAPDLTATGAIMGTPNYMAPEQASGAGQTTTLTDVYALGAILYEVLTGRPPLVGSSYIDTLQKVQCEDPAPPSSINPGIDAGLAAMALRCLRKQPPDRYADAAALAADLQAWLAGEPLSVRPPGLIQILKQWAHRHLKEDFWANAIGLFGGALGGFLLMCGSSGYLFIQMQELLARFPSAGVPAWLGWVSAVASITRGTEALLMIVGTMILCSLGLVLGFAVDLTDTRRALRCGLNMGLVTGFSVALALVPQVVLLFAVIPDLATQNRIISGFFQTQRREGDMQWVLSEFPELNAIAPEELSSRYFGLSISRRVTGIYEGAWFSLAGSLLAFPIFCVGEVLLTGLVFRRIRGTLRRLTAYTVIALPGGSAMMMITLVVSHAVIQNFGDITPGGWIFLIIRCLFDAAWVAILIHCVRRYRPLAELLWLFGLWVTLGQFLSRCMNLQIGLIAFWPYSKSAEAAIFGCLAVGCLMAWWTYRRRTGPAPSLS